MSVSDPEYLVLVAARSTIADPSRWTKRSDARDGSGHPVEVLHKSAVCWCPLGAVERAAATLLDDPREQTRAVDGAVRRLAAELPGSWLNRNDWHRTPRVEVFTWNDQKRRTHDEVVSWFGAAIDRFDLDREGLIG